VGFTELLTRCARARRNVAQDLRDLNAKHTAWVEGQLKWERERHTKLYQALRDADKLLPTQAEEVTIGDNRIVYSALFLDPDV